MNDHHTIYVKLRQLRLSRIMWKNLAITWNMLRLLIWSWVILRRRTSSLLRRTRLLLSVIRGQYRLLFPQLQLLMIRPRTLLRQLGAPRTRRSCGSESAGVLLLSPGLSISPSHQLAPSRYRAILFAHYVLAGRFLRVYRVYS